MLNKVHFRPHPLILLFGFYFLLTTVSLTPRLITVFDTTPPVVDVWYGSHQVFGLNGTAQHWVNVLGNAADPESHITSLRYWLNDGPAVEMRTGPDDRRLLMPGDFNVEIDRADLKVGTNRLVIEATNGSRLKTTAMVTLEFQNKIPALPFVIDWSIVKNAQDVLQIVDGKWRWDANGIRPVEPGYDRFLAVGDTSWTNYEVTVPVTVYGIDNTGFTGRYSGKHAGISVDLRWLGHSDDPRKCDPPRCGWNPVGAFSKYFFKEDGANYLGLKVKEDEVGFATLPYQFEIGHTYIFKTSVETIPQGNRYRMKVWEKDVEPEPANWMFERLAAPGEGSQDNPTHGAFALVAHHTDVSFGNIVVTAILN